MSFRVIVPGRLGIVMGLVSLGLSLSLWALRAPPPGALAAPLGLANCWVEVTGDSTVDFSSNDASAVRSGVAAVSPGGVVKIAGYCAGAIAQGGTTQVALLTQTLTLAGGYTVTNWTTPYPLTQPTTLDAVGGGRVISTTGAALGVTLQGFKIINGYINSAIDEHGGGIFAAGALTLTDMVVYSNTITSTTSMRNGGGVYVVGAATIARTTFSANVASGSGGGAYVVGTATVTGTTFSSNTAFSGFGGGVYVVDAATVLSAAFTNNSAEVAAGGAYFDNTANLTATNFISNLAYTGGGAFFTDAARLMGGIFNGNRAVHRDGGGALFNGPASLTGTIFSANTAVFYGGGARFQSAANVTGATFSANTAFYGSGGALFASTASVTGTTFNANTTAYSGGGATFVSTANVTGTTFIANTAANGGGAYFMVYFTETQQLVNGLFARNHATALGAAVYVANAASLHLLHTTIVSPTAPISGVQAMYVQTGTVYLTNTLIASHTVGIERVDGSVREWHSLYASVTTPYMGSVMVNGSLTGTAAFIDPATDNFHLTYASSAINAGILPNPAVSFDIDGDLRPTVDADIGYDEYRTKIYLPFVTK